MKKFAYLIVVISFVVTIFLPFSNFNVNASKPEIIVNDFQLVLDSDNSPNSDHGEFFPIHERKISKLENEKINLIHSQLLSENEIQNEINSNLDNKIYIPPSPEIIAQTLEDVKGFDCSTVTDVPEIECKALVGLYESTNGAGWINKENWLSSNFVDDWYGIILKNNHVIRIDIQSNNLVGNLPESLKDLGELKELVLANNQLSGFIPVLLGDMRNLVGLALSWNQLSGSIPESIGNLVNLDYLYLQGNQLSGPIPNSLGNLVNLLNLWLSSNQLSGEIPISLGNLNRLYSLFLGSNPLSGSIPLTFTNLVNLNIFEFPNSICTPTSPEFLAWKATVINWYGPDIICPSNNKLKLLVVPLNWQSSQENFENIANLQINSFINEIPLSNCRDEVLVNTLDVETQNFNDFTCSKSIGGISEIRYFIENELSINPTDWDVIIGLVENSPCSPVMGRSNGINTIWVTSQYDIISAHELGHIYDLEDQYCSNQAGSTDSRCNDGDIQNDGATTGDVNWLDDDLPCDCPPDATDDSTGTKCCNYNFLRNCSLVNYGVCCLGNKNQFGGRSTMSFADAPGPRGFDIHELEYLRSLPELNCPVDTSSVQSNSLFESYFEIPNNILDINLRIFLNDTVEVDHIRITEGRPTQESILRGLNGNYSLIITDQIDNIIINQNFNLFFDYFGPVLENVDYSSVSFEVENISFQLPYSQDMNTLKIFHKSELIFSSILPSQKFIFLPFISK